MGVVEESARRVDLLRKTKQITKSIECIGRAGGGGQRRLLCGDTRRTGLYKKAQDLERMKKAHEKCSRMDDQIEKPMVISLVVLFVGRLLVK